MILLKDITKTFVERSLRTIFQRGKPKKVHALNGVSLEVQSGEIFGLLGPNGAGKTTLIKILATLILPDAGSASICGYDLYSQSKDIRKIIGLVNTSERSFYWRLTGKQNLDFFASLYNLNYSERENRIKELLNLVGLEDKPNTRFMKYSSGQKQRLSIARTLLNNPEVLLMDEPTNSLDPVAATELRNFVKERLVSEQGRTILWCTHNLNEAEELCNRLAILHKGKVIAAGNLNYMQSLLEEESFYKLKVSTGTYKNLKNMNISPINAIHNNGYMELEIREKEENIPFLMNRLVKNGAMIYTCNRKEPSLEQIFENLIKKSIT